ncbi:DNA polymerase III subunit delta [Myxococcota bacterium]|nr:DNA polymerase III subunit delta [Myxococcota bacterium]MBU1382482.1 DNA polymerase III subunit delta [Myxococcota bacterium]MBU1497956.1 DNA polymerase III subunit delta [Myxococcota bacterium]
MAVQRKKSSQPAKEQPVSKENHSPVYGIFGDEHTLKQRFIKNLRKHLLDDISAEFNHEKYDGKETPASQIISAFNAAPMLGDLRLVEVRNVDLLSVSELVHYTEYIKNPSESTCAVLIGNTVDKKKSFFKELIKQGYLHEFEAGNAQHMGAVIRSELKNLGLSADPSVVQLVIDVIGNQDIQIALEKLSLYKNNDRNVTADDVFETIGTTAQAAVFKFIDSIFDRDYKNSLIHLSRLKEADESPINIVALIARQLRFLVYQKASGSPHPQAGYLGSKLNYMTKKYTMDELYQRHRTIYKCDLLFKSTQFDDFLVLENLVISWCLYSDMPFIDF